MILAVDVDYRGHEAIVAGILFRDWTDETPLRKIIIDIIQLSRQFIRGGLQWI
jgi:deoxyinosine 3'endonuclease (endonuclease V)